MEDQENVCFICSIERSEFEKHLDFEEHLREEHNIWNYLYYLMGIEEKYSYNRNEMSEIEGLILERFKAKNTDWFPIGRSYYMEKKQEEAEDKSGLEEISKKLSKCKTDLQALPKFKKQLKGIKEKSEKLRAAY